MKSIVEQVLEYSESQPDKVAITDGKTSISYSELASAIFYAKDVLANKYGLTEGDYIVVAANKQPEFVYLYFACHIIGAIVLPIAPDTNLNRYHQIKELIHPRLIIEYRDDDPFVIKVPLKEFIGKKNKEKISIRLDKTADIMFTTGTTGEPKGVLLSQKNISSAAQNINLFIGNNNSDVEMIALPISHSFGIGRMRCALSNGQTIILLGSFFNVKRFYKFISDYRVTGFGMVPSSWNLLKKLSGLKLAEFKDQLNYIEIGSAPMPLSEKELLLKTFPNTRICMHYGLTEASRSTFMEFHESKENLSSIGKPTPNVSVIICDEHGHEVPFGVEGEICVSGDSVTRGYVNASREEVFWGDYFRTGDWGVMTQDGYISLKSRKKELINVGGKKVSPIEVEDVLMSLDFVDDCACIGIPDPKGILGEVIKAFIVTSSSEKVNWEYIDSLIGTKLEGYKHPNIYEEIKAIPKTDSGKVQRLLLKRGISHVATTRDL